MSIHEYHPVETLVISEQRYRRLFEAARDGILILDGDYGKIIDANPFMSELLGYSREQLLGKELWEIGLLKDRPASQEAVERLKERGYIRYEDLPLEAHGFESAKWSLSAMCIERVSGR